MKNVDYKTESIYFLKSKLINLTPNRIEDIQGKAMRYIRESYIFKKKDKLEAHVLLGCLVNLKFLKIERIEDLNIWYSLTDKGYKFIRQ